MLYNNTIWAGLDMDTNEKVCILPRMANRHGLIAGATGTGKTITLKVLAESFSNMGVPVFLSDIKGDLSGMIKPGVDNANMQERIQYFGLDKEGFTYQNFPTQFWDISGKKGLPLRTTVSEFGPTLLSRILGLTDLQTNILTIIFRIADEENLLLLDTKDLRSMVQYVAQNNKKYSSQYGNMTTASLNAILRSIVALETAGADKFFGEPAIDIHDFFRQDSDGRGMINILEAESTVQNPVIYATFMLYMLSELFEQLPEVGDREKPKMVYFFDEAHLLFNDAPKALVDKIEQVVKLIRSKGVGIFFITQNPSDVPDSVLAQLGNKIQHALHAYTPSEEKKVKAAADSFRVNKNFSTVEVLQNLGTGEALISFLDEEGKPDNVRRCRVLPPQSLMGPADDSSRLMVINSSDFAEKYSEEVDRDSAYEFFKRLTDEATAEAARIEAEKQAEKDAEALAKAQEKANRGRMTAVKSVGRSTAGTLGREAGGAIGKTFLGTFGKRVGGNIGAALGRGLLDTFFRS
ncbi:helicase HerA-like domain-containing protein [Oribacterium sp. FC2011]|uniref:helicase HerA-like domain-containing protein n=1 Tax=Oribacterium sp. FC2011 TaxID=1408311 RepID=UPI0004E18862|nr:helicase HerA-like domain-containing protein [Oribacterium sp. FC2011]